MKFSTIVAMAAVFSACLTMADEPPKAAAPSSLQSFDASIGAKLDAKLDGISKQIDDSTSTLGKKIDDVNQTIGNRGADADEIKSMLRDVTHDVGALLDLLDVKNAPQISPPLRIAAPPAEKESQSPRVTIDGVIYNLDEFVNKWHEPGRWKVNPNVTETHEEALIGHHALAASEIAKLTESQRSILHEAIHSYEEKTRRPGQPPKVVVSVASPTPAPAASSGFKTVCENGVCRRVPIAQSPLMLTPREARKAARGK